MHIYSTVQVCDARNDAIKYYSRQPKNSFINLCRYKPELSCPAFAGEGKSGQHRAAHHVLNMASRMYGKEKVPQKITVPHKRDEGENVR
jgi:hypothetical protein